MSPPGATRQTSTDPQVLLGNQGDDGIHPDVRAYADELGDVTPYRLRWLQRQYDRGMLRRVRRDDHAQRYGPPVLTAARRSGSVPVDRLGESIANQQSRRTA